MSADHGLTVVLLRWALVLELFRSLDEFRQIGGLSSGTNELVFEQILCGRSLYHQPQHAA
jgi:hypothetical protein